MEDCLKAPTNLDLIAILSSIKVGNYKADTNCGFSNHMTGCRAAASMETNPVISPKASDRWDMD